MSLPESLALSRPVSVARVSGEGMAVEVVADAGEREALARELGLPAVHALEGRFRLVGDSRRVTVSGRVRAEVEQVCVVTLEPFPAMVDEEVDVAFEEAPGRGREPAEPDQEVETDLDRPDEIVGGRIDLGALAAEFLALGLDPYPRKPGATFDEAGNEGPDRGEVSPFSALAALRTPGDGTP